MPSNIPSKTERGSSCIPSNFHPISIQIPPIHPISIHPSKMERVSFAVHLANLNHRGENVHPTERVPSESPSDAFHPKTIHPRRNGFHPILHPMHSIQKLSIQSGTGFIQLPSTSKFHHPTTHPDKFSIQNGTGFKQCFRQIPSRFPSKRQKLERGLAGVPSKKRFFSSKVERGLNGVHPKPS